MFMCNSELAVQRNKNSGFQNIPSNLKSKLSIHFKMPVVSIPLSKFPRTVSVVLLELHKHKS